MDARKYSASFAYDPTHDDESFEDYVAFEKERMAASVGKRIVQDIMARGLDARVSVRDRVAMFPVEPMYTWTLEAIVSS